eukprot:scaffold2408_cov386-Prasinococcus_capsulatus_cf.AAC.9
MLVTQSVAVHFYLRPTHRIFALLEASQVRGREEHHAHFPLRHISVDCAVDCATNRASAEWMRSKWARTT